MALTAAVTLPSATMQIGKFQQAQITISNGGGAEVLISNAVVHASPTTEPTVSANLRAAHSPVLIPPNSPVPPSGTLVLTCPIVFQSGTGNSTNTVGCLIYGADGEVIDATTATVTVIDVNPYA